MSYVFKCICLPKKISMIANWENHTNYTKHLAHLSNGLDEAYWQRQVEVHGHYYLVGVLQEKSVCTAV